MIRRPQRRSRNAQKKRQKFRGRTSRVKKKLYLLRQPRISRICQKTERRRNSSAAWKKVPKLKWSRPKRQERKTKKITKKQSRRRQRPNRRQRRRANWQ